MKQIRELLQKMKHVTYKELAGMFKVHRGTIRRWTQSGKMPRPVMVNSRKAMFDATEVIQHMNKWKRG